MHCPACQHLNLAQPDFCEICGAALPSANATLTNTTTANTGGAAVGGNVQGDVRVTNTHTTRYHTQVAYAQNLAIGDGARVVVAQPAPQTAPPPQIAFTLLSPTWPAPPPLLRVDLLSPTARTLRVCAAFEGQSAVTAQPLTLRPGAAQALELSPPLPATAQAGWAVLRAWVEGDEGLLAEKVWAIKVTNR